MNDSRVRLDSMYEALSRLTPRERLLALDRLDREQRFSLAERAEARDYFRIGHDRRDIVGLVGQVLGRYRVVDVLGHGGSATVYLAETLDGALPCALKLLLPEASSELETVFNSEVSKLARVQAPGVVRLLDHGEHVAPNGTVRPFLVTEIVFGTTLGRYVERRQPPVEERVGLVAAVAETLATLYLQHALVHLDVKPDNILVGGLDRQPRLIDFGIACVLDARFMAAASQQALTPEYASPEQLFPERFGMTGSHSDQYSLALVLRALLGKKPPVGEERAEGTRWVEAGLGAFELGGIRAVLMRALEPDAGLRYPDLPAFSRALRDAAAEVPDRRRRLRMLRGLMVGAAGLALFVAGELATRPVRAELANRAGRVEQEAKRPVAAARAFARAAELEPNNAAALYNGAVAAEDLGELARARALYSAARESAADPVPALNNLARLLLLSGRAGEAIPLLDEALRSLPGEGSGAELESVRRAYHLHKNLGWAELELARSNPLGRRAALARAEREIRAAIASNARLREHDLIALDPTAGPAEDAAAYCLLGEVLAHDPERLEQSKNWWRRCLAADPHAEPTYPKWQNEALSVLGRDGRDER